METVYFLVFIGICAIAVVWATRRSQSPTNLAGNNKTKSTPASNKLHQPVDNRLAHRDQLWKARRDRTSKGYIEHQSFVPKSESHGAPEYDGYSRRDRHHLTKSGQVREDVKVKVKEKDHDGFAMTAIKFESDDLEVHSKSA